MDRARKKLASAIDGIRNFNTKIELNVDERISPDNCSLNEIVRHGFPDDARCIAYDPVQKLIAIGAGHGTVRLLGQSGVDYLLKHETTEAVIHIAFLVNEGGLVTVQRDDTIHLWNYRQHTPEIVNSMQMSKERVTCLHLPFQSKWLYIGTDKGNVYFVCLANFELSTYLINWNKAIDLSCRIHPGAVKHLAVCPTEPQRLLIAFEKSHVSMWNLQTREAEQFAVGFPQIKCISWHHDGKQFMCGHSDGSLSIWNIRKPNEAQQKINPHSTSGPCKPITHLIWQHNIEGEPIVAFVGGLPAEDGALPAVSIMRGRKSTTVAEMDHNILGIVALNPSPFQNVPQLPYGIAVLLKHDFLVIDVNSQGFSCFENPHAMDIHESPVTKISYFADCPVDLIAALTLVGRNQRKQGVRLSDRPWPVTGGVGRECASGLQEVVITGHEDGSIKFWQASSESLQIMYKLKTGRHFEKVDENKVVSYAVTDVVLDPESRLLLVASACGQVTLFRFVKTDSTQDIAVVLLSQLSSANVPPSPSPNTVDDDLRTTARELRRQLETSESRDSHSTATSTGSDNTEYVPVRVRGGACRRPAGYQPELVCQIPWISNGTAPEKITAMALNSAYGVLAIGTAAGIALVDIVSYIQIHSFSSHEIMSREPIPLTLPPPNSDASPSEPPTPTITVQPEIEGGSGWSLGSSVAGLIRKASKKGHHGTPINVPDRPHVDELRVDSPSSVCSDGLSLSPAPNNLPSRSQSVKKIVRRMTGRLKRAKSFQTTVEEPAEPIEYSPALSECGTSMHSSTQSPMVSNTAKSFIRLNTEKCRSVDRRPILAKAQSIAAGAAAALNLNSREGGGGGGNNSGAGSEINSPAHGLSVGDLSNGDSKSNLNGGSRSSSLTSLEKLNALPECVTSLSFVSTSSKRNQPKAEPSLWLGMSTGSAVCFTLQLPSNRITNSVVAAPSGSIVRLPSRIIATFFLDRNFCLVTGAFEAYRDSTKDSAPTSANLEKAIQNRVLTQTSQSPNVYDADEGLPPPELLSQLAVFVSEHEIKVVALPAFQQVFSHRPDIPLVLAKSSHVRGYPVLLCLNGAGNLAVFSLPTLKPLLNQSLFKGSVDIDDPICGRTDFSEHGLGMYMASPSEIQKFTACTELAAQVADCAGELFVPVDMPEPPKTSFLKGVSTLFAGQKDSVDLDTIFSEKPSSIAVTTIKSVARAIPVNNMEAVTSRGLTAGQAAAQAIQNLNERGDKLNAVVDATENLRNNAMNLQSRSSALVQKYEKKKWYQL
uniref:V-SNARE coiled-coil homology domain-containing protein n=1 Tax=Panagrellus redivivus TaxID=6233 RepID=A0A7E4VTT2_PANRE